MPLRRIFSDEPLREGATVCLSGEAANHVAKVLRLRSGNTLVVFDGSGRDFEGEITGFRRDEVKVAIGTGRAIANESPADITLLQGVCRGPRMDTVIQKATELGVRRMQPVLTGRSVVRLDADQAGRKQEHWRRVAISACEQCGRSRVPVLDASTLASIGPGREPIALLVGPEGGLTEAEARLAIDSGFQSVRIGPRILRTETAPLAALAILQLLAGDLG
jgi:16S rRNA (uracil1498-N3)-methyltransferase